MPSRKKNKFPQMVIIPTHIFSLADGDGLARIPFFSTLFLLNCPLHIYTLLMNFAILQNLKQKRQKKLVWINSYASFSKLNATTRIMSYWSIESGSIYIVLCCIVQCT